MTLTPATDELLQRSIDGALTDEDRARLEDHLVQHPEDAARLREMRRHTDMLASSVPEPSAAHLRALRDRARPAPSPALRIAASIGIFALGVGFAQLIPAARGGNAGDMAQFAQHAQAAHALYVSEVLHPVEVAATERDHLQSWLSNRLGAAIIAPELNGTGYSLIGGRLLPAGDQATALFMYENAEGDRLSLLATHGVGQSDRSFRFQDEDGFLTVTWQDGPWRYSLVGQRPREDMDGIARMIHGQLI